MKTTKPTRTPEPKKETDLLITFAEAVIWVRQLLKLSDTSLFPLSSPFPLRPVQEAPRTEDTAPVRAAPHETGTAQKVYDMMRLGASSVWLHI